MRCPGEGNQQIHDLSDIYTIIRITYFERTLWIAMVEMDITNKKMWIKYRIYKFLDRICSIWHFAQSQQRDVIFCNVLELILENGTVFIIHMIKASVRLCVLEFAATTWKRSFRFIETTSSLICNIQCIMKTTSDTTFRFTEHFARYTEMHSWESPNDSAGCFTIISKCSCTTDLLKNRQIMTIFTNRLVYIHYLVQYYNISISYVYQNNRICLHCENIHVWNNCTILSLKCCLFKRLRNNWHIRNFF